MARLRQIGRDQVRLGMYVHAFDGPWLKHPFWRRRFLLTKQEDLVHLLDSDLTSIVIDEEKGLSVVPASPDTTSPPFGDLTPRMLESSRTRTPMPIRPDALGMRDSHADERARAMAVLNQSKRVMKATLDGVRSGNAVRPGDVAPLVDAISLSMERNRHALIGLTRLKCKDEYTYIHSVAVGALMINMARQLDLDARTTHEFGLGGLLHDVGKMIVPDKVLNKPAALTDEEFALVRTHPEQGYQLLSRTGEVSETVLDICRHHHERYDGTGYPFRLPGGALSIAARVAAICDVYDALTSTRAYKQAWTPVEAITRMRAWEGHFDPVLLFRFMQSIGVFPVGMLVRLRSNRLAIVLDNGRRGSRPRVRAFYATREAAMLPFETVAISDSLARDQIVGEEDPARWGFHDWAALRATLLEHSAKRHVIAA